MRRTLEMIAEARGEAWRRELDAWRALIPKVDAADKKVADLVSKLRASRGKGAERDKVVAQLRDANAEAERLRTALIRHSHAALKPWARSGGTA